MSSACLGTSLGVDPELSVRSSLTECACRCRPAIPFEKVSSSGHCVDGVREREDTALILQRRGTTRAFWAVPLGLGAQVRKRVDGRRGDGLLRRRVHLCIAEISFRWRFWVGSSAADPQALHF